MSGIRMLLALLFLESFAFGATSNRYTNEWAVELKSMSTEDVDALAEKHGFTNFGKVSETDYRSVSGISLLDITRNEVACIVYG